MDTSEQYIEMCGKAEEIQAQWSHSKRNSGDFYFHRKLNCAYVVTGIGQKDSDCVWLPRQDQLQEMVRGKLTMWQLVQKFWNWLWTKEPITTDLSMEQLWLAFVMKEKYNKMWDGGKWVTQKKN